MKQIVLLLACLVSVHATVPLLKLFFNASFYAETSNHSEIQLPLNASPSVLYEHYEREILINCTAPNELFQLHRDFFMYGPDKTCQIQSWLKAPSIIAHESKGLIDKYVRFIYHNKSTEQRGFIDQVMEEYAMVSAEDVECFFNCNPLLDFTVSSLWAANLKHIPLKLDTFAFLWQDYLESPEDFLASIVEAKIPSHFATYAAAHVKSGDSVPVAEYFCSFLTQHGSSISPRAIEDYSLQFFHALLNNHKAQLGILNSFEGVVSNRTNVRSYPQTLLLLAESTRRGDFLPSTIRCLLHFRNKVTARDGNSTVYVDALSVAVRAYSAKPELSAEFLSLFEETVHLLAQDVLFFDWNVIHAVLHHLEAAHTTYAQRVAELDDLQGAIAQFSTVANCTIPLLRTIAERYPLLPQKTANKVLALSMHLLKFSKSKDFDLKALLVVFSRLRTQGVSLPTALLSTVAPVLLQLSPRHVTVERAALKALATLSSESLQVPLEVLEKLPAVARRINETGVFQSAISILRSYADKLSAPTLQALVEMEKAQGIALARARSELNTGNFFASLDDATRSYLLGANATVQEAFESHFELMISRMDWTLDEAVSLANHCNASTVDTFLHALRYITSYNVSASLLSDMGYHVLDIVSGANSDDMKRCGSCVPDQQAALSWREAIKSMSEQHTLFPSLSASDLLKGVTMSNRTCLSYASESAGGLCVVDVSLSTNVSLWVRSQLQLVGDLEGRGALQLVYAAKAGENRSAAVQFYLSGDARQLVAEHLASKTVVVNGLLNYFLFVFRVW